MKRTMATSPYCVDEDDRSAMILERLHAMRSRESEPTSKCYDYHNSIVDASCRTLMIDWCTTVVDAYDLSNESVAAGFSLLDRYLSSGKGKCDEALRCRPTYQLAAVTCFYTAVKVHEPVKMGIDMLIKLCRGYYRKNDVLAMERDIFFALDWRICASTTTPLDYVRIYLELLPEWAGVADDLTEHAEIHARRATRDVYFSICRTSSVGAACLALAVQDSRSLSSFQRKGLMRRLRGRLDFELYSLQMRDVGERLTSDVGCVKSRARLEESTSVITMHEQASSPVSVLQGF